MLLAGTVQPLRLFWSHCFFSGEVEVLVVDNPTCDVVLGIVPGGIGTTMTGLL